MNSLFRSVLCSPIRLLLLGLVTIIGYVLILSYYMHNNFISFDFHPHQKHGATSTKDDIIIADTHHHQNNEEEIEKPPTTVPKRDVSRNPRMPMTTSSPSSSPSPLHHHIHHNSEMNNNNKKLRFSGYSVDESDHRAHAHPGGTEDEANRDRTRLESHNSEFYKNKNFWKMWWRVADFEDDDVDSKKRHEHLPEALLETQEHINSIGTTTVFDEDFQKEGSSSYALLDLLRTAVKDCNNDVELNNFACLISSYDRQMKKATPKCRSIYGSGLIERLQKKKHVMCQPQNDQKQHSSSSSLVCHNDRIHSEHNIDTAVCGGSNLVINYNQMLDGDFPWLQFQKGALSLADCNILPSSRQRYWNFMHCLKDWMDLGFNLLRGQQQQQEETFPCNNKNDNAKEEADDEDEDLDTFFVTRSGDYSPFALAHDWVNTVIVYAVGNISRSKVQINIMERMTVGFYSPMWSLAFSPGRSLSWFPELRRRYGPRKAPNGVCYGKKGKSKAWFNIPARLSPLYNNDECGASPILRFTSDLLVSSVGAGAVQSPMNVFVVTVIVRRNYQTGHTIERRIPNWKELVQELRRPGTLLKDDDIDESKNNYKGRRVIIVHAIDYADFDFDQQLNISRSTDLLIGMHGAGLIQSMFLPRYAGLFEFFCPDRPPSNNRYENLARRLGIEYSSYDIQDAQNVVPVKIAVAQIERLAKKVFDAKKRSRVKKMEE